LREDDPEFREEHEKLLQVLAQENSPAHRSWTLSDTLVVRAWVEGRYEVPGESWQAFRERVASAAEAMNGFPQGESVAVFSSATPIAVWVGMALALEGRHMMRLAGVTYNAALTTMRVRAGDLALFSFNGTPHLPESRLRTFR
jgi:broad specificity phosphatase PhoE